jgi:hypothetical protein
MSPLRGAISGSLILLGLIIWTYNGLLLIQAFGTEDRDMEAVISKRAPGDQTIEIQSLRPRSIDLNSDGRDPFSPMSARRDTISTTVRIAEPQSDVGTVSRGPDFELLGILWSVDRPVATLSGPNGAVSHVSRGGRIADLTVNLITPDSVVLQHGAIPYEIKMDLIPEKVFQNMAIQR